MAAMALGFAGLVGCESRPVPVPASTPAPANGIAIDNTNVTVVDRDEPQQAPTPPPVDRNALSALSTPDLISKLASPVDREAASDILVLRGEPAIADLVKELLNDDWRVRSGAAFTLGRFGASASSAVEPLEAAAKNDAEPAVRDAAAFALDAIREASSAGAK